MTEFKPPELPSVPGYYIWHILDLHYLEVGLVQVLADGEKHRAYLDERNREERASGKAMQFFQYQTAGGLWLTMYHSAHPHHQPPADPTGRPYVDGYQLITLDALLGQG